MAKPEGFFRGATLLCSAALHLIHGFLQILIIFSTTVWQKSGIQKKKDMLKCMQKGGRTFSLNRGVPKRMPESKYSAGGKMAFKKILLSVLLFAVSASYSFSTELLKRYFDGADHDVFITCVDYTGNPLSDGELLEITFDSWKNALDNYVFNYYEDYPFKEYTLKNIREDIQKFYEWNKNCVYVLNFESKKSEYFQEYLFVKEFEDGTVHCLCTWWVKIHGNSVR